jgi:hypothetical protein
MISLLRKISNDLFTNEALKGRLLLAFIAITIIDINNRQRIQELACLILMGNVCADISDFAIIRAAFVRRRTTKRPSNNTPPRDALNRESPKAINAEKR